MRVQEYGDFGNKKIILIHGTQVPWQIWTPIIEYFSKTFHVLIPTLPGHDPMEKSTFHSVEKAASDIEQFYMERYGNHVFAICGQSLGGAVAAALWTNQKLTIDKLFLEGTTLLPQPKLLTNILTKQYLSLLKKTKRRDPKTLQQAETFFLPKWCIPPFLEMMDAMTEESVRNFTHSVGEFCLQERQRPGKTEVACFYGTTLNETLSKKSAKFLKSCYPQVKICRLEGLSHCEMSLHRPEEYIKRLEELLLDKA